MKDGSCEALYSVFVVCLSRFLQPRVHTNGSWIVVDFPLTLPGRFKSSLTIEGLSRPHLSPGKGGVKTTTIQAMKASHPSISLCVVLRFIGSSTKPLPTKTIRTYIQSDNDTHTLSNIGDNLPMDLPPPTPERHSTP